MAPRRATAPSGSTIANALAVAVAIADADALVIGAIA